jgi:hypothetical protein
MCFLEGFGFCSKVLLLIVLAVPRGSSTTGGWWRQSLKGRSGRCLSCWVYRWTTTMWIHIAKYPFWQRGNSNEMEQRVGEPDRVIEEIQVFHRRSQLWGTQCCKPGITWNLHAAICLKLETLKWHCILGIPRGLICLHWRCHFMHGSSYAYYPVVKVGSRKWGSAMQLHSCILSCGMFTYLSHFFVFSSNVPPRLTLVFKTQALICELLQVFFSTPY